MVSIATISTARPDRPIDIFVWRRALLHDQGSDLRDARAGAPSPGLPGLPSPLEWHPGTPPRAGTAPSPMAVLPHSMRPIGFSGPTARARRRGPLEPRYAFFFTTP